MTALVTFVVPTWQRPGFLNRLLTYYATVSCEFPILIADSSEPDVHRKNLQTVHRFRDSLDLELRFFDLGVTEKCNAVVEFVKTPYLAFSADDDFQIPRVMRKSAEFLDRHKDYQTCSGRTLLAVSGRDWVDARSYRSVTNDAVRQRLNQASLGQYYCLFYGLHRTDDLRRRLQIAGSTTNSDTARILSEAMLVQLLALDGKFMQLPETSYIMEGHYQNFSQVVPEVQDVDTFSSDFASYLSAVTDAAVRAGVNPREARAVMRQSFLDLVPGCLELVSGPQSLLARGVNRIRRTVRKLGAMQGRRAGRKYQVDVSSAAAEHDEVRIGLDLLQRPMQVWDEPTARAA